MPSKNSSKKKDIPKAEESRQAAEASVHSGDDQVNESVRQQPPRDVEDKTSAGNGHSKDAEVPDTTNDGDDVVNQVDGEIPIEDLTIAIPLDEPEGYQSGCQSPGHDPQLAGYPPDCGTKTFKYLSYAKCHRDRGLTHPMCYSQTERDLMGHPVPKTYPVIGTDFGAHSFHTLPTDSHVLSKYGIGVSLYFKFLKVMSWLFLIMFVISLPVMSIYIICGSESGDALKLQLQKNPLSILGMTSMGHLGESQAVCAQAKYGESLTLTCPYGEIGFIEASYSLYDSQGQCSCPQAYQVNSAETCRGSLDGTTCPSTGSPCYLGGYPTAGNPCCAYRCSSPSVVPILQGICMGQTSCTIQVNDSEVFQWKYDPTYNTRCLGGDSRALFCQGSIADGMDTSSCPKSQNGTSNVRGIIARAQCMTTQIVISNSWAFRIMGWNSITRQHFVETACGLDILYSVVFILIVWWMKRQEKNANARILKERISVENYTVQLMHLPAHKDVPKLAEELKTHLETVLSSKPPVYNEAIKDIKIADINFGLTNATQINLMRKRGDVAAKLDVALQRIAKFKILRERVVNHHQSKQGNNQSARGLDSKTFEKRMDKLIKASNKIDDKFAKYEKQLDEWEKKNKGKSLVAVTAYITFEEEEGYLRCLREYPNLGALHRLFQPYHKRFKKKRMWIQTAPDPTDIIWENLDYTLFNRTMRIIVVNVIALSLLCLSFIVIYVAKVKKNDLTQKYGAPVSCPAEGVSQWDVIQEQTSGSGDQTMVMCFCKAALLQTSLKEAMNIEFVDRRTGSSQKYCDTWGTQYLEINALMVASVWIVVIINACLTPILRLLVLKQKSHTRSGVVVATVYKIFIAQFFNTALIVLLLNANMDDVMSDGAGATIAGFKLFSGKYSDFSVNWYNDIGISLMLTMIINMVSPHADVFITYVIMEMKRFIDRGFSFDFSITRQDTQRDLEALYRGPEFDLASRYSVVMNTIFITLLFSSGMPLMLLIGLFSMIITYWTDKFTFLRVVRSPPQYDGKIATAAGNLLPWAILLHALFGIWMYSNTQIFDAIDFNISGLNSLNNQLKRGGRIVSRAITMPSGVMFALLVAIVVLALARLIVFRYFASAFRSVFPTCFKMLKGIKEPRKLPNYFDAIPTFVLRENLAKKTLKPHLREQYTAALARRGEPISLEEAAESKQTKEESGIMLEGCHSYDILMNPIYNEAFGGGAFSRSL
ncbi:hypothetical protein AeMF1_000070 [Aphanomyces euteiches]|nr:hypothetical protein AeMF1_000070 [Aphanomyces euteiches]KAH9197654.1 hypothetical protein AeNC1_000355 [Aphanomyces euteiches]